MTNIIGRMGTSGGFVGRMGGSTSKALETMINEIDSRVDTIIAMPVEGVSAQEIIAARGGEATLGARINGVEVQLADTPTKGILRFLSKLLAGEVTKIKLIGDSVTAGAQCLGYNVPADGRIILTGSRFNDGGAGYAREAGTAWATFPSWANLFRKYVTTHFPTIDFFNAGVGGLSLSEALSNYLPQLITDTEDVLFIMLGINDRASYDIETYKTKMRTLIDYAKTRSNLIVLMSPPPTRSEFVNNDPAQGFAAGYQFSSNMIDNAIRELGIEYGIPVISHFINSSLYMSYSNTSYTEINSDNTHPTTKGYKIIWENMEKELNIIGDVNEFNYGDKLVINRGFDRVVNSALIATYQLGSITNDCISSNNAEIASFPEAKAGLLTTYRPSLSTNNASCDAWGYQEYRIYGTTRVHRRYCDGTNWGSWNYLNETIVGYSANYLGATSINNTTTPDKFPETSVSCIPISNSTGFPETALGVLKTVRTRSALETWTMQEYSVYQTNRIYGRYWAGSAWSAWKLISGNLALTTTARTALSTVGMTAGDMIFDTTLNKPVWRNAANTGWVDATGATV